MNNDTGDRFSRASDHISRLSAADQINRLAAAKQPIAVLKADMWTAIQKGDEAGLLAAIDALRNSHGKSDDEIAALISIPKDSLLRRGAPELPTNSMQPAGVDTKKDAPVDDGNYAGSSYGDEFSGSLPPPRETASPRSDNQAYGDPNNFGPGLDGRVPFSPDRGFPTSHFEQYFRDSAAPAAAPALPPGTIASERASPDRLAPAPPTPMKPKTEKEIYGTFQHFEAPDDMTFNDAFREARRLLYIGQGERTFTWRGKRFTTELASDARERQAGKAISKAKVTGTVDTPLLGRGDEAPSMMGKAFFDSYIR